MSDSFDSGRAASQLPENDWPLAVRAFQVPADRRRAGRDSLRSHEDGVARNGRARRDCLAPGVSGLRAVLGIHAALVPTVSRADERESGIGNEA